MDMAASDDVSNSRGPAYRFPSNSAFEGPLPESRLRRSPRMELVELVKGRPSPRRWRWSNWLRVEWGWSSWLRAGYAAQYGKNGMEKRAASPRPSPGVDGTPNSTSLGQRFVSQWRMPVKMVGRRQFCVGMRCRGW